VYYVSLDLYCSIRYGI